MSELHKTTSVSQTEKLGSHLARRLERGDLVALEGELGSGKTALVRGIAVGLGVADGGLVNSPTYVLVQQYAGRVPVYHIDLYRLADAGSQLEDLGLREMLAEGVVLIEWAARAGAALPRPHWRITITATGKRSRQFKVERVA